METPERQDRTQAEATLAYIRDTMESASTFTAVSGWGLVGVGVLGLVAVWLAWAAAEPTHLAIWVPTAALAIAVAAGTSGLKARRLGVPLWSSTVRKMAWGLMPALAAGGMLTLALIDHGSRSLIPGVWLAVYGAGLTASGTFSIGAVRSIGLSALLLGGLAMLLPELGLVWLAVGFGAVHIGFGFHVAYRHGG